MLPRFTQCHVALSQAFGLLLILLLGSVAIACRIIPTAPEPIHIGLIAPFSGEWADTTGKNTLDAATLVVETMNAAGGLEVDGHYHPLVLHPEDDQGRPEVAVQAAQRLINQEMVIAIIGPQFSSNAIPVAREAELAGIPMISPASTNPQTTAGKRFVFRASFVDDLQGKAMAQFARRELGAVRAAILYDIANPYNRGLAEVFRAAFEDAGGNVSAFESYTSDTNTEFDTQLRRIRENEADVLYLPNYTDDVARQVQQAREIGISATIIGSDSWDGQILRQEPFMEGAYFSAHFSRNMGDDRVRQFVQLYEETYGRTPDGLAALTYDAIGLLFATIQAQGEIDPLAIRDGLYDIVYTGVTGRIFYEDSGDPVKDVAIWRIGDLQSQFYMMASP